MTMKRIEAVVQSTNLDSLKHALRTASFATMTISEVNNVGTETRELTYRGVTKTIDAVPKTRIELIVDDERVETAIDMIGQYDPSADAWLAVSEVERLVRSRGAGEVGRVATKERLTPVVPVPLTSATRYSDTATYHQAW
jgi:nitrogen regulatory protein PII